MQTVVRRKKRSKVMRVFHQLECPLCCPTLLACSVSADELPTSFYMLTRQINESCDELVVKAGWSYSINYLTAHLLPPC